MKKDTRFSNPSEFMLPKEKTLNLVSFLIYNTTNGVLFKTTQFKMGL